MKVLGVLRKCVALAPVLMLVSSPAVMAQGKMWHTIRYADGTWHVFGDVTTQAGWPGYFGAVSIAGNNASGEVHVVGQTYLDGKLWHTIRYADGTWHVFGDVTAEAPGPYFVSAATALIGGDLHVVATTSNGTMWHTIRYADGTWQQFGDVPSPAVLISSSGASIAGNNASGEVHVVDQADGKLWHTIRYADGTWQVLGDVTTEAGWPGYFTSVATAFIGGDLHVVATDGEIIP